MTNPIYVRLTQYLLEQSQAPAVVVVYLQATGPLVVARGDGSLQASRDVAAMTSWIRAREELDGDLSRWFGRLMRTMEESPRRSLEQDLMTLLANFRAELQGEIEGRLRQYIEGGTRPGGGTKEERPITGYETEAALMGPIDPREALKREMEGAPQHDFSGDSYRCHRCGTTVDDAPDQACIPTGLEED